MLQEGVKGLSGGFSGLGELKGFIGVGVQGFSGFRGLMGFDLKLASWVFKGFGALRGFGFRGLGFKGFIGFKRVSGPLEGVQVQGLGYPILKKVSK